MSEATPAAATSWARPACTGGMVIPGLEAPDRPPPSRHPVGPAERCDSALLPRVHAACWCRRAGPLAAMDCRPGRLERRVELNRNRDADLLEVGRQRVGCSPITPGPIECIHWNLYLPSYVRTRNPLTPCRLRPCPEHLIVEPSMASVRFIGTKVTSARAAFGGIGLDHGETQEAGVDEPH